MKKIFTNDHFFTTSVVLSTLGMIIYSTRMFYSAISKSSLQYLSFGLTIFICPICLIFLFISYKKHNKNVMKALMGALLMALVIDSFSYLQSPSAFDVAFAITYIAIDVALFANHILINCTHHSSKKNIAVNQFLLLLLAIAHIVWFINSVTNSIGDIWVLISFLGYVVGYVFMATSIVCIESRLDAYRIDRENAGWNENDGYQNGYCKKK